MGDASHGVGGSRQTLHGGVPARLARACELDEGRVPRENLGIVTTHERGHKPDPYLSHWADLAASRTLKAAGGDTGKPVVVAAGITPSGVVHIGNFREVMTVDLVARALRDRGAEVRFIYSWDDFDVFRKVPENMPQREMLEQHLRRSIVDVPDPFGVADSYAGHHIDTFERSLVALAIAPEFIRQSAAYRSGTYAAGIRRALEHTAEIRAILNEHRKTPLADDWLPLAGFCDACGSDELDFSWSGDWQVSRNCRPCGHSSTSDLREGGNIKLPWRIDWPMRWQYEQVRFEPGGKDHSSAGGSYDTGKAIVDQVYGWTAPQYVAYDFVSIKGRGGKISSSSGGVVTVSDALAVYEPELLRWVFANYRPNTEFQISFDLDAIKIYEDYDRARRLAHQSDDGGKNDKKRLTARRTLQLASLAHHRIQGGDRMAFLPSFRPLSIVLQIHDGDIDGVVEHYRKTGELVEAADEAGLRQRASCVWNWITDHAPEDFRYRIRDTPTELSLTDDQRSVLRAYVEALTTLRDGHERGGEASRLDPSEMPDLRACCEGTQLDVKSVSPLLYELLVDRPKGPKMATLVATMGIERALPLLSASLET